MKITTLTIRYAEKRSENYQSVEVAAEITVQVQPGENPGKVYDQALELIAKRTRAHADQAIAAYRKEGDDLR